MREAQWAAYDRARTLLDGGDAPGALAVLDDEREALAAIPSATACLEASCYEKLGDLRRGLSALDGAVASGSADGWVHYQRGFLRTRLHRPEDAARAFQDAHAAWGWPESKRNGYRFTHDYFSPNIATWSRWFDERIVRRPIRCLEIGSWQGGSAAWLLDRIVSPRGGSLTCIDTFEGSSEHAAWLGSIGDTLEDIFDRNMQATGHASLLRKLKGYSQDVLMTLHGERFDFMYVDGAHEAKFVIQDAVLCWRLLETGGFMLFDDVDFRYPEHPEQDSLHALDFFKATFRSDIEIVEEGRQLLIRKLRG